MSTTAQGRSHQWQRAYVALMERDHAKVEFLKLDTTFRSSRREWLRAINHGHPFRETELSDLGHALERLRDQETPGWHQLQADLGRFAARHGVTQSQVLLSLFLRDYSVGRFEEADLAPTNPWGPRAALSIGRVGSPSLLRRIADEGLRVGIPVVFEPRLGSGVANAQVKVYVPIDTAPGLLMEALRAARRSARTVLKKVGFTTGELKVGQSDRRCVQVSLVTWLHSGHIHDTLVASAGRTGASFRVEDGVHSQAGLDTEDVSPYAAFGVEASMPIIAPISDMRTEVRQGARQIRALLREIGLDLGERLATASTLRDAASLRVGLRLEPRGIGDILDQLNEKRGVGPGAAALDERDRAQLKSRRHKAKRAAKQRGYTR